MEDSNPQRPAYQAKQPASSPAAELFISVAGPDGVSSRTNLAAFPEGVRLYKPVSTPPRSQRSDFRLAEMFHSRGNESPHHKCFLARVQADTAGVTPRGFEPHSPERLQLVGWLDREISVTNRHWPCEVSAGGINGGGTSRSIERTGPAPPSGVLPYLDWVVSEVSN
jgi:hypothetical protein